MIDAASEAGEPSKLLVTMSHASQSDFGFSPLVSCCQLALNHYFHLLRIATFIFAKNRRFVQDLCGCTILQSVRDFVLIPTSSSCAQCLR